MSDSFSDTVQHEISSIDRKAAREIDESRWYLIKVIDELYNSGRKTNLSNVRRVVFEGIRAKSLLRKSFYLGVSIDNYVEGMVKNEVLETIPRNHIMDGTEWYKLTNNGREYLEYFGKDIKIFK